MDETRAINGNLPHADIYRTKAASSADDGDGGGLGNAYEKARKRKDEDEVQADKQSKDAEGIADDGGSDPLLQALDRMKAVEGYHPVDQSEVAQHQAARAYVSTTIRRKAKEDELPANLSKLEQHGALEEKRVDALLDEESTEAPADLDADVDYLPHDGDAADP